MSENFEILFESSEYSKALKLGQLIQADVINITNDHAILSAGLKSESLVNINQFKNFKEIRKWQRSVLLVWVLWDAPWRLI